MTAWISPMTDPISGDARALGGPDPPEGGPGSNQFDAGHRGVVALTVPELQDAQVPTGSVHVSGSDLLEQLVGHVLVPDERHHWR